MTTIHLRRTAAVLLLGLGACEFERPPIENTQYGYRGLALEQNVNPRLAAKKRAANTVPATALIAPAPPGEPAPAGTWQNVQALNGLSVAEFNRTMLALSQWVSPKEGCAYCHNVANMASDEKYQKVVARRMLQMTQQINGQYTNHVKETGVTCYTCHRGNHVPQNVWFYTNRDQPLRHYLDREGMLVTSNYALAGMDTNRASLKQAVYAYNLMANVSSGLGVNCTFCHNTRALNDWSQSSPQRLLALRGMRMLRDVNMNYLVPLQAVWPEVRHPVTDLTGDGSLKSGALAAARRGPLGDGAKAQCATCHQGVNKPLYGLAMAKDYPALYPAAAGGSTAAQAGTGADGMMSAGMMDHGGMTAGTAPAATPTAPDDPAAGAMGGRGPAGQKKPTPRR